MEAIEMVQTLEEQVILDPQQMGLEEQNSSIEEIIEKLTDIVTTCKNNNSKLGYFAVLYLFVTHVIKKNIEQGNFEDNKRMEVLDVIFAKRYIDAFEQWIAGNKTAISESWYVAFEYAEQNQGMIMQHMLLGINAHINLDLGIATCETMNDKSIIPIINDFTQINDILNELTEKVENVVGKYSLYVRLVRKLGNKNILKMADFSIAYARTGAWYFAGQYNNSKDKKSSLVSRDAAVAAFGSSFVHPKNPFVNLFFTVGALCETRSNSGFIDDILSEMDHVLKTKFKIEVDQNVVL